ncbi:hypothetical protein RRU01S_07_05840 [Agrobacterium rubi TR3 = NBRC 13261]|uniref:Uncharacterized protein n=1 Tax=Agrobacterium rubi TR3 = NBRC 13261 TaxID=1368415 RepID=A0A081CTQ9_9HYPH|nr:hypothetical protein RRU01S_07_05840 [Agrobacterium rubi TR3 = NBRC 13261]
MVMRGFQWDYTRNLMAPIWFHLSRMKNAPVNTGVAGGGDALTYVRCETFFPRAS